MLTRLAALLVLAAAVCAGTVQAQRRPFDLVLRGGRVIDPASGLDAVRHIAVRDGRIAAISTRPLEGREIIDVSGLVVAPGFVDLHAHGQDLESSKWQAHDGVTTALELEGGAPPRRVSEWYAQREGKARLNFGATVSHVAARRNTMAAANDPERPGVYKAATPEQLQEIEARLREGLAQGALGIGMGLAYTPGATREESWRVFKLAAAHKLPIFVHVRSSGMIEPGSSIESIHEVIANAAGSAAVLHIVHIASSGLRQTGILLDMIDGARRSGVNVTTEVYPYTAGSTRIQSAIFDEGWRERLGADYADIEWVATGERLNESNWDEHRKKGGWIIGHIIPEEAVDVAVVRPGVIIASDGTPFADGRAHPRGAGTFARVLGRYVREKQSLTLMDALRKMTILPARRLESFVPQMMKKGRLAEGMDADITVFDPATVIDRATFARPAEASAGVLHVVVNGTFVVRDGKLIDDVRPGRAIRRPVAGS
jgi:N-acyl-D-aspartate/D-glutamate deacylase